MIGSASTHKLFDSLRIAAVGFGALPNSQWQADPYLKEENPDIQWICQWIWNVLEQII